MVATVGAFALAGCSSGRLVNTPDATPEDLTDVEAKGRDLDAIALVTLADQAAQHARQVAPDATLRQVDLNPDGSQYSFRFADYTMVRDVDVFVPGEDSLSAEYEVVVLDIGYLAGHKLPGIELSALRVGPAAAGKAATDHWDGCELRVVSITGQAQELFWNVFCGLPEGVVSGIVDGRSGIFRPSPAPPARIPPTAMAIG